MPPVKCTSKPACPSICAIDDRELSILDSEGHGPQSAPSGRLCAAQLSFQLMNSAEPPLLLAAHLAPPSRSNAQGVNDAPTVGDGEGEALGVGVGFDVGLAVGEGVLVGEAVLVGEGVLLDEGVGDGDSFTSSGTLSEFRAYAAKTPILIVEIVKASRQRTRMFRQQILLALKLKPFMNCTFQTSIIEGLFCNKRVFVRVF